MIAIVITGPESTGKSVLTNSLAKHFGGLLVDEYARQYVESSGGRYTFEDVEEIGRVQIREYKQLSSTAGKNDLVFFDTFLIITKVWFQEVFFCCPVWIHQAIEEFNVDFALLCAPDIPWQDDGVRENPHRRDYLYDCYYRELEYYNIPFTRVEGQGTDRFENAVRQISLQSAFPLLKG
ncbi:ATP-binding protein [Marinilabilia sp.]|uniref:ATP-binding protein n=1 Tax=Marinilabilia sp. TaxID=2021252 RepID=UPI0025BEC3BC|nr:ATP-binding protein [Marinilabilia sp.]